MKSVMVDIETLSTRHDAAIISIGLAKFDEKQGVYETHGITIRKEDWYGHIDPATVKWWMEQEKDTREYSFNGTTTAMLAAAEFSDFVKDADEVWANSPSFDLTILKSWWNNMVDNTRPGYSPGKWPVHYRAERDCRTIFTEARRLGIDIDHAWKMGSSAHNPVDDAANQARAVIEWRKQMKSPYA